MVCMSVGLAGTGCFLLPVQATPATLKSPDATVYEQTSEGSNAVGSLVEGSSFEYIGDVTAEDGSVWHQVTTANGASGYIRGDRELELREEEPVPESQEGQNEPEGQDAPAEDGGDTAPAGNEPPEGNAPEDNGDGTPEEGGGEEEENPGDGEPIAAARNLHNEQAKKYVMDTSAKVKEKGSLAEINAGARNMESKKAGIDTTLVTGMAVVFLCVGTVILCLSRMRKLKWETGVEGVLEPGRSRTQRKIEKKKHSQKRKVKKPKRL